jgi:hypothetical protein
MITGATEEEHLQRLEEVLYRLEQHGIRVKLSKCKFMGPSVEFLGHRIDAEGLHATNEKLKVILRAPPPEGIKVDHNDPRLLGETKDFFASTIHCLVHFRDDPYVVEHSVAWLGIKFTYVNLRTFSPYAGGWGYFSLWGKSPSYSPMYSLMGQNTLGFCFL